MGCFNSGCDTGFGNWWWIIILLIFFCNDSPVLENIRDAVCGDNLFIIIALLLLCNTRETTGCMRDTNTCGCN